MPASIPPHGAGRRTVVFLPCHTLDHFPTWLEDREADDLLAAWTAAWHPRLVAAGGMPGWASVDLPPPAGPLLGIVPRSWDDRFAAQFDAGADDARFVRGTSGRPAIAAAALAAAGAADVAPATAAWVDDFAALGLAVLLGELLARRMRHAGARPGSSSTPAVVAAASAAVDGRADDVRAGLAECFRCLEAVRARYYPVDAWLVDLVLLAASTPSALLSEELAAPVPLGVVAEASDLAALAARDPDAVSTLRRRIEDGGLCPCGGPRTERQLDACLPEEILESFAAGMAAWNEAVGRRPEIFARRSGGGSAILPQVLAGLGYAGAVWSTFDGAPLPDPGAGRILWEGAGGATIEVLARPPLDARSAAALLALPERLGDAMDHDHAAVVTFAHHAGTACEWHALLRRIGARSTALGTFLAPDELLRRTAGSGTRVAFGSDAFPPTPLPAADRFDAVVEAAAATARRIVAQAADLRPLVAPVAAGAACAAPPSLGAPRPLAGWWFGRRRDDPDLVLESAEVRVEVHAETGGLRSVRRPGPGPNRLSQRLALRHPDGHGGMHADAIGRGTTASGAAGIVSRGRLLGADGSAAGTFVQGLSLVPGLPLVVLDLEVQLADGAAGPLAERHVACQFAWHENEEVEIRRSVHAQSVVTERTRFTAPHFVEIAAAGPRGAAVDAVTILSGGLPWHALSSPHVLDTILAGPAGSAARRLAVGIGLERPWDAALELLAGSVPGSGPRPGPANVRVAVHEVEPRDGRPARARVGLVESAGSAGPVRIEWARDVAAATVREYDGRPRPGASVAIEGRAVVVFLRAHEWLTLDLDFVA